jgi:AmmeMemoRadiSam system protein A
MLMTVLTPEHKQTLLDTAFASIEHSLTHHTPLVVKTEEYALELQQPHATFVTLHINRMLRGCIGMLEAIRPLIVDVAQNAHAAAFSDPRFSAMSRSEFDLLDIHISILNPYMEMQFTSQEDLISQLVVGKDGLILEEGRLYRGTFLPSVWESLPDPASFLMQLKQKAGLTPDYWSDTLRIFRYTVDLIPERE